MRTRLLFASLALGVSGLTACGSSGGDSADGSSGDYCSDLKSAKTALGSLQNDDMGELGQAFTKAHTLAKEAPDEVATDWKTVDGAITTFENKLEDAGINARDLPGLQQGQIPKGADLQKLRELSSTLQSLSSEKFSQAVSAIEAHAKKVCRVDLSSAS